MKTNNEPLSPKYVPIITPVYVLPICIFINTFIECALYTFYLDVKTDFSWKE